MKKKTNEEPVNIGATIRLPRKSQGEMLAVVIAELGGARMQCFCEDGRERICRVPGRLRRKVWVKEGDVVIVKPWDIEGDKRGDILWRYKKLEVNWLREKGKLDFYESS